MIAYSFNPSTLDQRQGDLRVPGQFGLQSSRVAWATQKKFFLYLKTN